MQTFSLTCSPIDVGWCDTVIRVGDQMVERSISYLGLHPAHGLIVAAQELTDPDWSPPLPRALADVELDDEDRGLRILLTHTTPETLHVIVRDDQPSYHEDGSSTVPTHVDAEVSVASFVESVHAAATLTLARHGIEGFTETWIRHGDYRRYEMTEPSFGWLYIKLSAQLAGESVPYWPQDTFELEYRCMMALAAHRPSLPPLSGPP